MFERIEFEQIALKRRELVSGSAIRFISRSAMASDLPKDARDIILDRPATQQQIGCFIHLQPVSRSVEAQIHKQRVQRRDARERLYLKVQEFSRSLD